MSEDESTSPQPTSVEFQADLSPADAAGIRDALLTAVTSAQDAKSILTVTLLGEQPTPRAVQLLVATTRSAQAAGVELSLSESAGKVLAGVNAD